MELALKLSCYDESIFLFKVGCEEYRIKLKDILYFKSRDREVEIVLTEGRKKLFYATMNSVLLQVEKNNFIQTHKSYIVNYNHIIKFKSDELVMLDGSKVPIARSKKSEIEKYQLNYKVGAHIEY